MAILKTKKTRELSEKEMTEKLKDIYMELSKERASSEIGGSVKNPGRIRELRRAIARIKTERARRDNEKSTAKRSTGGTSNNHEVIK